MLRLEYSDAIGKVIRQDDLSTLGTSSQTMAEWAVAAGNLDEAAQLADYFLQEIRMMGGVMYTFFEYTLAFLLENSGDNSARASAADYAQTTRVFDAGASALPRVHRALERGDGEDAVRQLEHMRFEYRTVHDLMVQWNQDLLT